MKREIARFMRGTGPPEMRIHRGWYAISIRVVVFTENANPAKSLKPKPNKTSQQPPPTQKETKNKSHRQHPPSSGSANETNLGLFFFNFKSFHPLQSPSRLLCSVTDLGELLHGDSVLLSVVNLWARAGRAGCKAAPLELRQWP